MRRSQIEWERDQRVQQVLKKYRISSLNNSLDSRNIQQATANNGDV